MRLHPLTSKELVKAIGIGVATALLLSAVMVPLLRFGVSPLPQPLGLAFAETVLQRALPLPVGLLFHVVYVTAWSVVWVSAFRDALSFKSALLLGVFLWVLVLLVFFPVVGWGFFGLAVGPQLIIASLIPHLLFALFLWALARTALARGRETASQRT